ncbi:DUF485 domain-containing protein [Pseudomonas sp. CR3202]|uniref:DUF485 domain-containing protein n=1 Tax=Pseudomonas sp. CR3202 TaxID=3351532 RepID=UPI003BF3B2BB
MTDPINERILRNPRFHELVSRRQRFAGALSALIIGLYLAFILTIAFAPGFLGGRVVSGSPVTWGIPIGIGLDVLAFLLTGIYVYRANGEFDRLNEEILKEARQ